MKSNILQQKKKSGYSTDNDDDWQLTDIFRIGMTSGQDINVQVVSEAEWEDYLIKERDHEKLSTIIIVVPDQFSSQLDRTDG